MIAPDFFETVAWQALEIVAGCDYLCEPEGEGFEAALKHLKALKLVGYERMEAAGIIAKGYRVTDAGRQLVNVMTYARAREDEDERDKTDAHRRYERLWSICPAELLEAFDETMDRLERAEATP